ncbi:protein IAL1-like, partial [Cucurbita moschata]|uniref:Protein IAL1-like n=1 Tax=Cucurbita moschata TaxID=3662 RepID=A0A6J1HJS2_CUCMO
SKSTSAVSSSSSTATTQACAACKYQRRKCVPDCILAPYFPHHRQRQFLNAHKLFGVSNITKIIKNLDPFQKEEAMRTIIFQSDVRSLDPVGGCYRIIRDLQRQIQYSKAELEIVLHQLAICKHQAAASVSAAAILDADHPMSGGYAGIEHQFVEEGFVIGENENAESLDDEAAEVWGIQASQISPCSSFKSSVHDFDHVDIHYHHQQFVRFHPDHHQFLHKSEVEAGMVEIDNVILKEDSEPMQNDQDGEVKGAYNLWVFFVCFSELFGSRAVTRSTHVANS